MALVPSLLNIFARAVLALILIVGAGFSITPKAHAQAEAGWSVCNRTSYVIEAAAAFQDGAGIVVNGWTRLIPGSCEKVMDGPLKPGAHFLYAQTSRAHRGGRKEWQGDQKLCVDTTGSFSVESKPNCAEWGLDERGFQAVAVERRTSWKTELTEVNAYDMKRARIAGVQRLLRDVGASNRAIDGYEGPSTRRAIARFLRENEIKEKPEEEVLIDLLEQAGIQKGRNVGLTLCNRTRERVWGAIARLRAEGWESRGWWRLEGGGCARVIDEELIGTQYFVFGEMEVEGDDDPQPLAGGADRFCVARSKFAIIGRENCAALGYRPALFVSAQEPTDGKLVFEFFGRDFTKTN
ncbi:MAG: DUF1036 domain-containing protein [Pseudomonadota bacterium]